MPIQVTQQSERHDKIPSKWRTAVLISVALAVIFSVITYYFFGDKESTSYIWGILGVGAVGVGIYFYILQTR
jgi:hypothetical protein